MKKDPKSQIIKKIEKEIINTQEKIHEYKELSKPIAPENSIGRISRMDAINNKSVVEAALREMESKFEKLKIIKKKVHSPEFGICVKCRCKIPFGRIILIPENRSCVNCAN